MMINNNLKITARLKFIYRSAIYSKTNPNFLGIALIIFSVCLCGCGPKAVPVNCGSADIVAGQFPEIYNSNWCGWWPHPKNISKSNGWIFEKAGDNYKQIGAKSPDSFWLTRPGHKTDKLQILINLEKKDSRVRSTMKLDFDGTGNFTNQSPVSLYCFRSSKIDEYQSPEMPVKSTLNGRNISVIVSAGFKYDTRNGKISRFRMELKSAALFEHEIDGQKYLIRIYDGNCNLKYNDRIPVFERDSRNLHAQDFVQIFKIKPDGTAEPQLIAECFYGMGVKIGAKHYRIAANNDATDITITEILHKVATVSFDMPYTKAVFAKTGRNDNCYLLFGKDGTQSIARPGKYSLFSYEAEKDGWTLTAKGNPADRQYKLKANAANKISCIFPLKHSIEVKKKAPRKYAISFVSTDAQYRKYRYGLHPDMEAVYAKFEIRNSTGEIVHTDKFEYG